MVGFIGDGEVREAWRVRDGRDPFRQAQVNPGGADQMLRSAPPLQLAPPWGMSQFVQDPQHLREQLRKLRDNEAQGTAISHLELLKVPRSRLRFLIRPGLLEAATANEQRHASWRDDPTRHLCREQHYRCQVRATALLPPLAARSSMSQLHGGHQRGLVATPPEPAEHSGRPHPHGETRSPKPNLRRGREKGGRVRVLRQAERPRVPRLLVLGVRAEVHPQVKAAPVKSALKRRAIMHLLRVGRAPLVTGAWHSMPVTGSQSPVQRAIGGCRVEPAQQHHLIGLEGDDSMNETE